MNFKTRTACAALFLALSASGSDAQTSAVKPADINGFTLGMTPAQVKPLLAKLPTRHDIRMAKMPTSNETFVRAVIGMPQNRSQPYDRMFIIFSGPPSGNKAVFISRKVRFGDNERPSKEATVNALKAKYGTPFATSIDVLYFGQGPKPQACNASHSNLDEATNPNDPERSVVLLGRTAMAAKSQGGCQLFVRASWTPPIVKVGDRYVNDNEAVSELTVHLFSQDGFIAAVEADEKAVQSQVNRALQTAPRSNAAPKL
jgi:hypothetical protein